MEPKEKKAFEPSGLVPRSIVRTFERFRQQLLPGSETAAIREYRISRYQVLVSARCLFTLLIIPIATNWLVSSWLLSPLVEHFWNTQQNEIFLNSYQEERAFAELESFSEKLFFESLLNTTNTINVDFIPYVQNSSIMDSSFPINSVHTLPCNAFVPYPWLYVQSKPFAFAYSLRSKNKSKGLLPLRACAAEQLSAVARGNSLKNTPGPSTSDLVKVKAQYLHLPQTQMVKGTQSKALLRRYVTTNGSAWQRASDLTSTNQRFVHEAFWDLHNWQNKESLLPQYVQSKEGLLPLRNQKYLKENLLLPQQEESLLPQQEESLLPQQEESLLPQQSATGPVGVKALYPCAYSVRNSEGIVLTSMQRVCKARGMEEKGTQSSISNSSIVLPQRDESFIGFNRLVKAPFLLSTPFVVHGSNESTYDNSLKIKEKVQKKIIELAIYYNQQTIISITNIVGDVVSLVTLGCLFIWMKPEITILKSFLIEAIYSLSDTTKSFLLILLTDLLVGFHSPRGWETALELLLKHFGLPENQDFVFLFVATFPVLLDTVFKYWIFRHLNKISPSTVATYHSMIE